MFSFHTWLLSSEMAVIKDQEENRHPLVQFTDFYFIFCFEPNTFICVSMVSLVQVDPFMFSFPEMKSLAFCWGEEYLASCILWGQYLMGGLPAMHVF